MEIFQFELCSFVKSDQILSFWGRYHYLYILFQLHQYFVEVAVQSSCTCFAMNCKAAAWKSQELPQPTRKEIN